MNRILSCVLALAGTLAVAACGDMTTGPTDPDTLDHDGTYAARAIDLAALDRIGARHKPTFRPFEHRIVGPDRIDEPIADAPAVSDDAQVLQVLFTLHGGQMALVERVLPELRAPLARDFALTIHEAHRNALQDMRRMRERNDMVLEPNDVSVALRSRTLAEVDALLDAKSDVDELFIAKQLGTYARALFIIDEILMPAAEKSDVIALLDDARAIVVRNRQLALRLHLIAIDGGLHDDSAPM